MTTLFFLLFIKRQMRLVAVSKQNEMKKEALQLFRIPATMGLMRAPRDRTAEKMLNALP